MKDDLKIDQKIIVSKLQENYQISVSDVVFLPKGEDGVLYKISDKNKRKYILKFAHVRRSKIDFNLLTKRLKFTKILKEEHNLDFVVTPIPTKEKELTSVIDNRPVILFPYIEGEFMEDKQISNQELAMLAKTVAKLHQVKNFYDLLPEDTPGTDFANKLKRCLIKDEFVSDKRLVELIKPLKERLLKDIEYFQKIEKSLVKTNLVVCHTDLSPGNLIFTKDNELKVIDWDSVSLSLPEQDINLFSGEKYLNKFMKVYRQELPERELKLDNFAYFKYRWSLEGIWERIEMINTEKISQKQLDHEFDELKGEIEIYLDNEKNLEQIEKLI